MQQEQAQEAYEPGRTVQRRILPSPTDSEQGLSTHLHKSHGSNHAYGKWMLHALQREHEYLHDCCEGTCGNHVHEED